MSSLEDLKRHLSGRTDRQLTINLVSASELAVTKAHQAMLSAIVLLIASGDEAQIAEAKEILIGFTTMMKTAAKTHRDGIQGAIDQVGNDLPADVTKVLKESMKHLDLALHVVDLALDREAKDDERGV